MPSDARPPDEMLPAIMAVSYMFALMFNSDQIVRHYYRSGNHQYCNYSVGDFEVHDSRLCCAKFHANPCEYLGVSGPKNAKNCQNFQLFRHTGVNPLPNVGEIHRIYAGNRSTVVNIWCNWVGKLVIYMQKTAIGHSPQNFQSPLATKLLVGLEKSMGCKNGTDILYLHAKFGGDPPLHGGVRSTKVNKK